MNLNTIKQTIYNDFADKAPPDFLKSIIDGLIIERCISDHMFPLTIGNSMYMENIYRIIDCNINYQKQKNENKLLLSKVVDKYCDDDDVLKYFNEIFK